MKVIGKQSGVFTGKDGEKVSHGKLFVTYDFPISNGKEDHDGVCSEILRVKSQMVDSVEVGSEIRPVYNKYGRIDDIEVL